MTLYWISRGWTGAPFAQGSRVRLALVEAADFEEAKALLGAAPNNECNSPDLVAQAGAHGAGEVWEVERQSTPSAYDRFSGPRGMDWQGMTDAGFEVS